MSIPGFVRRNQKGFTLIELLVVVAIIGILAAMVLVSLSAARAKAKDARIINDLTQLRTQIEADASGQSNYGALAAAGIFSSATAFGTFSTNYATLVADITANSSTSPATAPVIKAANDPVTAWALHGLLSNGKYFCVDSAGKVNSGQATAAATACL